MFFVPLGPQPLPLNRCPVRLAVCLEHSRRRRNSSAPRLELRGSNHNNNNINYSNSSNNINKLLSNRVLSVV